MHPTNPQSVCIALPLDRLHAVVPNVFSARDTPVEADGVAASGIEN
jgi:hypothetical protein